MEGTVATSTQSARGNSRSASQRSSSGNKRGAASGTKSAGAGSNRSSWRSTAGKTVLRGAGAAALGIAVQTAARRARKPRVLGNPAKIASIDTKKLAKQVVKVADRVERVSEDVRVASAQAKRIASGMS
jgi:hypothetical protein